MDKGGGWMQCWFFVWPPIKAPKVKTDAKRGKQNGRKQQAGALKGVEGKKS
jgi:hypothetical protein